MDGGLELVNFYKGSKSEKKFFFFGGGDGGARESEFFHKDTKS